MTQHTSNNSPGLEIGQQEDEFLSAVPVVRANLEFSTHDKKSVKIEDSLRGKFYNIGRREHAFICELDGTLTVGQAIIAANIRLGTEVITAEVARAIIDWLSQNNLLLNNSPANSSRLATAADKIDSQKRLGWMNPVSMKVALGNPTRILSAMLPATSWVFSAFAFFAWTTILMWAGQSLVLNWERFTESSAGILSNGRWIWLLVAWIILKLIHEAAHGIACIKYGGRVREAGILFLLFTPMAYVDVTSAWRFQSRRHRLIVSAAGMYAELFVASIALLLWARLAPGVASDICYNLIIMASVTTILFNANPLMRFDGYYLMVDLLDITNLYTKSQAWMIGLIRNVFFGFPIAADGESGWRRVYIRVYAVAAFTWKILLTFSLLIAASCLFNGAGLILAIVGGIFWIAFPLMNQYKQTRMLMMTQKVNWRRFSFSVTAFALLLTATIFFFAAPRTSMSPAQVQFKDEQILRAPADGFVDKILVSDGAMVAQGQPLMLLSNPKLQVEIEGLHAEILKSQVQSRIYQRDSDLDKQQAELHRVAGLQEQLGELSRQQEELVVRSPLSGTIHRRDLANLIGSYLSRGDMIASIGNANAAEVVVSIDQRQVDSIREIREQPVRILIPGSAMVVGKVIDITPRASDIPVSDQWCAPNGGPLTVQVVDESEADTGESRFRLLEPRFNATIELTNSASAELKPGQRGHALLHTRRQSLAGYLYISAKRWIEHKIEVSLQATT